MLLQPSRHGDHEQCEKGGQQHLVDQRGHIHHAGENEDGAAQPQRQAKHRTIVLVRYHDGLSPYRDSGWRIEEVRCKKPRMGPMVRCSVA